MRYPLLLVLLLGGACSAAESPAPPPESLELPALADLAPGWNSIAAGGETRCALDTDYAFFARAADTRRLLIHLQGGGACSTGRNCDPDSEPTYSRDVDDTDNPERRGGIFDLDHPANPVADYSMVFIPYCTGDVHLGRRLTTYVIEPEDEAAYEVPILHYGYINATAVLDWVFDNFDAPEQVVVTGSSAGSIPAPFYAQIVAERYPNAEVVALGDAAGSYRTQEAADPDQAMDAWGVLDVVRGHAGYENVDETTFGFTTLYTVAGSQHPDMRLYQFDAANDAVQAFFAANSGADDPDPASSLAANRAEIRASIDNFAAYTAGGAEHTVLSRPEMYTYEVDGQLFSDWFTSVVTGAPVADVDCDDCAVLELHYAPGDAELIAAALELLSEESAWGREEGRTCPEGASRFSLRCALVEAGRRSGVELRGSAAATAVNAEVLNRGGRRGTNLVNFNDAEQVGFEDIRALLETVAARIAQHEAH